MATKTPSPALIKQIENADSAEDALNLAWRGYAKEYGYPGGSISGTPAYKRVLPKSKARMNFQVDPKDMERILAWIKACGLRPEFRWSTGTLTITEETTMDTKDPLIEAVVETLKEGPDDVGLRAGARAFHYVVKECVDLVLPLYPMEQVQVAAAIVSACKRRLRTDGDSAEASKLETIERQLDRFANAL